MTRHGRKGESASCRVLGAKRGPCFARTLGVDGWEPYLFFLLFLFLGLPLPDGLHIKVEGPSSGLVAPVGLTRVKLFINHVLRQGDGRGLSLVGSLRLAVVDVPVWQGVGNRGAFPGPRGKVHQQIRPATLLGELHVLRVCFFYPVPPHPGPVPIGWLCPLAETWDLGCWRSLHSLLRPLHGKVVIPVAGCVAIWGAVQLLACPAHGGTRWAGCLRKSQEPPPEPELQRPRLRPRFVRST